MKATANVFSASTVRKERILLILRSWKYKLYTTDSPVFPLRETHQRTHQDSVLIQKIQSHSPEKPPSWCWPALALTSTLVMSLVLALFILSLFPYIQTPTSSMLDVTPVTRLENSEGAFNKSWTWFCLENCARPFVHWVQWLIVILRTVLMPIQAESESMKGVM